ncbi:hypothetical protein [Paenibacillus lautus]|uniref:hypothetical protein n=1 Tax=Paenibacillus lautus TaxID=1401 RepID=UPI003D27C737
MIDLQKADRFTVEAAELYGLLIHGKPAEEKYLRLMDVYSDVDVFNVLPDIYALRKYRYGSRGWGRLRERIYEKAQRFNDYCEGVRKQ